MILLWWSTVLIFPLRSRSVVENTSSAKIDISLTRDRPPLEAGRLSDEVSDRHYLALGIHIGHCTYGSVYLKEFGLLIDRQISPRYIFEDLILASR